MDTQGYANQLGWCITTRDYLSNLQEEIKHVGRQYHGCCEELRSNHYMSELMPRLDAKMREFVSLADATIVHVENVHLSYINERAKFVSEELRAIQNAPK